MQRIDPARCGADGMLVADICRKGGHQPGDLLQLEEYDGLLPTEMRRLSQLEDRRTALLENKCLLGI